MSWNLLKLMSIELVVPPNHLILCHPLLLLPSGWHHQLDGHEFEQAPGVSDGQGSLACCSPWGHKESDITERLD